VLLLLLTYLGTLYQIEFGLYQAQQRYFYSWIVFHDLFGMVPLALPGAKTLLCLLFVNLLLGGVIQARKGWRQWGVVIAHIGILVLLIGGFIGEQYSTRGFMRLFEGESAKIIRSYAEWEFVITGPGDGGKWHEYIVPEAQFAHLERGAAAFIHPEMPFDVRLSYYTPNARPQWETAGMRRPAVDGLWLEPQPTEQEPQRNLPGLLATVIPAEGPQATFLLWGLDVAPAVVETGGERWLLSLRKRQWPLPFTLTLEEFRREVHPGTSMPKAFSSSVVQSDGAGSQPAIISMNQPLRHRDFTVYQSSWGPQDAPPGTPLFSVFEIASNPTDRFPIYACIIVAIGMILHFSMRLTRFLRAPGRDAA
jgi:hypothetical protein